MKYFEINQVKKFVYSLLFQAHFYLEGGGGWWRKGRWVFFTRYEFWLPD